MKYSTCYGCDEPLPTESDYPGPFCSANCVIALGKRAEAGDEVAIRKQKTLWSLRIPMPIPEDD